MQKQLISRPLAAGHPESFGPRSAAAVDDESSSAGRKCRYGRQV
jgi:hypothetical protein